MRGFVRIIKPGLFLIGLIVGETVYANNCFTISGVVEDYATHQPLDANLSLKTPNGLIWIGQSAKGSGTFSFSINCQATVLLVECSGYRRQQLAIELKKGNKTQNVGILIPLVSIERQGLNQSYEQSEQRHFEQQVKPSGQTQSQRGLFTISDALTQTPLQVQACFFSTKGKPKRCLSTDIKGQFEIDFVEQDIIAIEIHKSGYQPYEGNIVIDQLDGRTRKHNIRLLHELTLMSVWIGLEENNTQYELRFDGGKKKITLRSVSSAEGFLATYSISPGRYQLWATETSGKSRQLQELVLEPGITFVDLRDLGETMNMPIGSLQKPVYSEPVITNAASPPSNIRQTIQLPSEQLLVYFEQGSYLLDNNDRSILRQVGAFMRANPECRLKLIGHTDPEGDEQMNRYLAEFRAKVIANFLYWEGVMFDRISISGQGSRYPISPSDTEENKAKNRRVFLKLEVKR